MPHRYEQYLQRFETEAKEVLKRNVLPTSASELGEKNYPARNRTVSKALFVVLGVHYLRKEIEKNRIHKALDRFLTVCDDYLEMDLRLRTPAIGPREVFGDEHLDAWLNQGKRSYDNLREGKRSKRDTDGPKAMLLYGALRDQGKLVDEAAGEVAKAFNISKRCFYDWKKYFNPDG